MTIHNQFMHLSLKYMWLICIQSARIISNTINLNTAIAYRSHRRREGESEFHTSFRARQYQHCAETYWPASTLVRSKALDNTRKKPLRVRRVRSQSYGTLVRRQRTWRLTCEISGVKAC